MCFVVSVHRRDAATGKRTGTRVRGGRLPGRRAHIRHDRRQHRQHDQQHERGPGGVPEPHGRRQTVHGVPARFQGARGQSHQVVRVHVGEQTGKRQRDAGVYFRRFRNARPRHKPYTSGALAR